MSFYTYYQAIPEQSRLLERLKTEKRFCSLYTRLIIYGAGPFHLAELEPSELDDVLNGIAEREPFGSRAEVDECLKDMQAELAHASAVYPGLKNRAAYIEKQHDEIEEPLTNELRSQGSEADVELMRELFYGGEPLSPAWFDQYEPQLRFVGASTVVKGAEILKGVELSEEVHDISDYACEQYQGWKSLVIGAAKLGEAVIVYPTG